MIGHPVEVLIRERGVWPSLLPRKRWQGLLRVAAKLFQDSERVEQQGG